MQNMNYYYDFSGQKFNHPLSLSINSFDRKVFSRQTSLELSYVLKGSYEVITEHISHSLTEQELAVIAPDEIHMLKKLQPESVILTIHIDFERIPENMLGSCKNLFHTILCTPVSNAALLRSLKEEIRRLLMVLFNGDSADGTDLFALNEIMMKILCIAKKQRNTPFEQLPVDSTHHENYVRAIQFIDRHYQEDIHLTDIAKTLSFEAEDGCILIVAAGDAKVNNGKFKACFGKKPKMLSFDDVEKKTGHAVGGVCPFAVNEGVRVYLDESLRRFETVYPACGSGNSAICLTCDELYTYGGATGWVDVCKGWRDEE